MVLTAIDLNADLGEEAGDDEALYPYLSSANICCGRHAGGPTAMKRAVAAAIKHDVVIGAHVGYDDRENFGRNDVEMDYDSLRKLTFDQIQDLLEVVEKAGAEIKYVKPHGALYHRIGNDPEQAAAVIDAIADFNSGWDILGPDTQVVKSAASRVGLNVVHEFFADRAYLPVGTLVPRTVADSVFHDAEQISQRVLNWLDDGGVQASDGSRITVDAKSICLHGDTPGAVESAASIHQRCIEAGYEIKSWLVS